MLTPAADRLVPAPELLMPHIHSAIRASPCTCIDLRPAIILGLVLVNGIDPKARIHRFLELARRARDKFHRRMLEKRDAMPTLALDCVFRQSTHGTHVHARNRFLNSLFLEHNLASMVRDYEEIAVAYNASLRYAWSCSSWLSRFIHGEGELESILHKRHLCSSKKPFVSTSLTRSPWFTHRDVFYMIKLTDAYRRRASPIVHTSVFSTHFPETALGYKECEFFEDEVRLENGVPVEPGTLEMTFRFDARPPQRRIDDLVAKYRPLGPVHILCSR